MTPLNYSSPFLGEINISYTWKLDEGGPILSGLGLSLSMYFNRPYNPYTITAANSELDYSIPGAFNSHAATPLRPMAMSQYIQKFTADAAIEKKFLITDKLAGSIYFKVKNVFDIRNILNVYDKTGSPYDDGYLYNPAQVSTIRAVYGETWYAWRVFLLNHDNSYIGLPSTFLVGIRLEY